MPAFRIPAVVVALLVLAGSLRAADAPLPGPGDVRSLAIHPAKVTLAGSDAAAQLVVTATLADGRLVDLTHDVTVHRRRRQVGDGAGERPRAPAANGTTEVVATFGDKTAQRAARDAKRSDENLPINFANQIVPIFTKLGCNSRRLPRQGVRAERLPPVAARLRAGARLSRRS